jgi:hypothetical protein
MMESRLTKSDRAELALSKQAWRRQVRRQQIRQVAVAGALGLFALAGIAPGAARAEDSGDNTIFGSVLKSLGIGGENNIEYRERPPLVVPPNRNLPAPQTARGVQDPNWPVDPKSADPRKKGDQVRNLDKLPVPQRPAEPGVAGAGAPNPSADTTGAVPPSQPAASGGFFSNLFGSGSRQAAPVGSAPMRKSLTEPPPDYESPSPGQPYGTTPSAAPAKSTTPESALQTTQGASQPGGPGL